MNLPTTTQPRGLGARLTPRLVPRLSPLALAWGVGTRLTNYTHDYHCKKGDCVWPPYMSRIHNIPVSFVSDSDDLSVTCSVGAAAMLSLYRCQFARDSIVRPHAQTLCCSISFDSHIVFSVFYSSWTPDATRTCIFFFPGFLNYRHRHAYAVWWAYIGKRVGLIPIRSCSCITVSFLIEVPTTIKSEKKGGQDILRVLHSPVRLWVYIPLHTPSQGAILFI